ncbi:MAG: DUF86 domain-containing protein [Selenomonadaceae bacterium]|nr:DUF86 domain-containing protein [Selenomonadaceae bacterium]
MKQNKFTDIETIQLMTQYCQRIENIVRGVNFDVALFSQDDNAIDATAMNIIQLGERINSNLTEAFKQKYPEIPWRSYVGMRNKLTHVYFELDTQILWESAINDVPALYKFCLERLEEEGLNAPNLILNDTTL